MYYLLEGIAFSHLTIENVKYMNKSYLFKIWNLELFDFLGPKGKLLSREYLLQEFFKWIISKTNMLDLHILAPLLLGRKSCFYSVKYL